MNSEIIVRGAREHNLKNITVAIPRDKLVVVTGVSGSGKSSLVFNVIYAEGQRRYVESLSSYARQFLQVLEKPDIDSIEGLSPAIAIDQKTTSKNPRSTVGTVTEIYDYLRLLYARIGRPHCPICKRLIAAQAIDSIVDHILTLPEGTKFTINAPVVRDRKGEYRDLLERLRLEGFSRILLNGEEKTLDEEIVLDKKIRHTIEVIVDRLIMRADLRVRLSDSLEVASQLADGLIVVDILNSKERRQYSQNFSCPVHGVGISEMEPRMFSFNAPHGACPECTGLGARRIVDPDLVVPDTTLSINEGALLPWSLGSSSGFYRSVVEAICRDFKVDPDVPWQDLSLNEQKLFLLGTNNQPVSLSYRNAMGQRRSYSFRFRGIIESLQRRSVESDSETVQEKISEYMSNIPCPTCMGARLKEEILAVTVGDKSIHDFTQLSIERALEFTQNLPAKLNESENLIGRRVLKEVEERLVFLNDVGVGYLTLSRAAATLSGGEAQRLRLATQIGSGLRGVTFCLDEPHVGLHARDNDRLIKSLRRLRDVGNTVIVVEHSPDTISAADHIIDLGPLAGERGGQIVAQGTLEEIKQNKKSITGQFLSGSRRIPVPARRLEDRGWFSVLGAQENNLRNIDVSFPINKLITVCGVSGSGKSSLINATLYKAALNQLSKRHRTKPGLHRKVEGLDNFDKVIAIDQRPIGRTPRSNPATYTDIFTHVRQLYAQTQDAKTRGYKPGRFSFNIARSGRCEACQGFGSILVEMSFLPDIYVPCETCQGRRYNREALACLFKGKNIAEVLDMSVDEALVFFAAQPKLARRLQTLKDVGLGYIKLGQPATTLSGGEAQRVKLAAELARTAPKPTLYLLDEPTMGLALADVEQLLLVLERLVDGGHTVILVEHHLSMIAASDYIIELGPEGGEHGGLLVAKGTPEDIAKIPQSWTGKHLKTLLKK